MNNKNIPPQDIETEISLLGALMIDKNAILKVVDLLRPEDFYEPRHQKIYETILDLFEKGKPVDITTVSAHLKEKKKMKDIGGIGYLTDLMDKVPSSAHAEHYAEIVREKKGRRDLVTASSVIAEHAFSQDDFEDLLDAVESHIFKISQGSRTQKFVHLKEGLPPFIERLEKLNKGDKSSKIRGIPTGFSDLDKLLSGLQKSDLVILGARPSSGKTSFALDMARNAALQGHSVGFFSLEMSTDQVVDRIISSQSGVPLWRLRTGNVSDSEFSLIQQALGDLSDLSLFVEDSSSPNILHIRSMARKLQIQHGLDMLVIDYLQLIQPRTKSDNAVQQITEISRGLKSLARDLNIPILALSQLSRAVEQRGGKPKLSDLRDSGSIEQDADVVMFIHKERSSDDDSNRSQNIEILIEKHRNGPTGLVRLYFDAERVTFRTIDDHHEEDAKEFQGIEELME